MPVLIEKGRITFPYREMNAEEKERNKTMVALDFIMEYLYEPYVPKNGVALKSATRMDNRIAVLQAATGSGKGSVGLEFLYRFGKTTNKTVVQTQPTTATAISVPYEVMDIPKYSSMLIMGETIGYATGTFIKKPKQKQSIIFTTTGYIAQLMKSNTDDAVMKRFSAILLDEAHARSLDYDLVFFFIKQFLLRNISNPQCPFFLMMSATLPVEKYSKYFGLDKREIIAVPGQTYPKEEHFAQHIHDNYVTDAVKLIIKLHTEQNDQPEKGDILCFVWGAKPSIDMIKLLDEENDKLKKKFIISKIDSVAFKMGSHEYFNVLRKLENLKVKDKAGKLHTPTRRVILATPAVEVGLTLSSLRYCIETGYFKAIEYNPIFNIETVVYKPVTQANALQRIGRIGRKMPGVFYTMYTKDDYNNFLVDALPDIIKEDMSSLLLSLIINDTMPLTWDKNISANLEPTRSFDVQKIDMLDYPAADSLNAAFEKLFVLGFINANCKPTTMGFYASIVRAPLENIRMLFEGHINGANMEDLVAIAAIIEVDPTRLTNTNKMLGPTYKPYVIFSDNLDTDALYKRLYISCDLIELLFAYYNIRDKIEILTRESKSTLYLQKWMHENGLKYEQWLNMIYLRDSYIKMLAKDIGINPYKNSLGIRRHKYDLRKILKENLWTGVSEIRKLKSAMFEGYRLHTATWNESIGAYVNDHSHIPIIVKSPMLLPLPQHDVIQQTIPLHIIVFIASLKLPSKTKTGIYEFGSYISSALDGFVTFDKSFVNS